MMTSQLTETANSLASNDKGLLEMGESNPTCNKRFAAQGIPQPALELWHGDDGNVNAAQQALLYRTRCNLAARQGKRETDSQ